MLWELAAVSAALCWSIAPVLYRIGLADVDAFRANVVRLISAAVILSIATIVAYGGEPFLQMSPSLFLLLTVSAIMGLGIGDTLYLFSIRTVGVARAVPLGATYPLFASLAAFVFLGEGLTVLLLLGTLCIVVGVWLLIGGRNRIMSGERENVRKGSTAALTAAILWGGGIILLAAALKYVDPVPANAVRLSICAVIFAPIMIIRRHGGGLLEVPRRSWLAMAAGGAIAMGIGSILFGYSIIGVGAAKATALSSISPFFATIAGALLFKEKVTMKMLIGSATVAIGIVLVTIG